MKHCKRGHELDVVGRAKSGQCKACATAYLKAWGEARPEKQLGYARKARRKSAGVANPTEETRGGPCEICGAEVEQLHLDHDHSTGAIRGWLCRPCNLALGGFKDSPAILASALAYLERHGARCVRL